MWESGEISSGARRKGDGSRDSDDDGVDDGAGKYELISAFRVFSKPHRVIPHWFIEQLVELRGELENLIDTLCAGVLLLLTRVPLQHSGGDSQNSQATRKRQLNHGCFGGKYVFRKEKFLEQSTFTTIKATDGITYLANSHCRRNNIVVSRSKYQIW